MTTQGYSRERSEGVSERVTMQRDYRERKEGEGVTMKEDYRERRE